MCIQKQSTKEGTHTAQLPGQSQFMLSVPAMHFLSFPKGPSLKNESHDHPNPVLTTTSEGHGEMHLYLNNSNFCSKDHKCHSKSVFFKMKGLYNF